MAADVQAVVAQVLIVGGRAVRSAPPGALAESAPRRVPRARQDDILFVLVTPAGTPQVPAPFFESLAQTASDVYFGSGGGVTSGLRDSIAAIHEQAQGQQTVNALIAVQRGPDLFAARCGRTLGVLRQGDELRFLPADRQDPLALNLPPLGGNADPDIQFASYTVAPDHLLLLADESLLGQSDDALRALLGGADLGAVTGALKALGAPAVNASVIRFLAPDAADENGTPPAPSPRAARDTSRSSRPASTLRPPAEAMSTTLPAEAASDPVPAASAEPAPEPVPEPTPDPAAADPAPKPMTPFFGRRSARGSRPAMPTLDESTPSSETAPERAGRAALLAADDLILPEESELAVDPPEPDPVVPKGPSVFERANIRVKTVERDVARRVVGSILAVVNGLAGLLNSILPAPDEDGKQGIPTNVAVVLTMLIPAVIVIVVVGLALSEQGKSEYELTLEKARAKHQEALTLSGANCDNYALRPLWVEVLTLAQQAAEFRPNDTSVLVIEADARNYLDCFDGVDRRDLSLLHTFASDAELIGPVVNGGVDLFVLDTVNDAVYHDTLNVTGDGLTTRNDDPILYRGQTVTTGGDTLVIEDLIDIAWLKSGGTVHDNVLVALDRNGSLWAYSPTFFTTAQQLIMSGWQQPVAMAVFDQWLYILDVSAGQIWRYVAPAGVNAYNVAPEEYFNGDELPDLRDAVDFGISDEGAVYILFRDGIVRKYRRNIQGYVEEQPFVYKEVPPGALTSGYALFIDNDPASTSLYVVDNELGTVYRTSWSGRYNRGIRPQNVPDAFVGITGIYADAVVRNNMYVVAGNKLYHFYRE